MDTLEETARALQQDWGIQVSDKITEEEIIRKLALRVAELVTQGAEPFFQLMYRLDIAEKKLQIAAQNPDAAGKIAKLIYDRQLQKMKTREHFKSRPVDKDPDLEW